MVTYTIRLGMVPDEGQADLMSRQLEGCRRLYNSLNNVCREHLKRGLELPDAEQLRAIAIGIAPLDRADDTVLENVGERVSDAYGIYRRKKEVHGASGLPRFKSDSRYRSMTYGQEAYLISEGSIRLRGVGEIPLVDHMICRERDHGYVPVPSCRVCVDADGAWRADVTFDMEWLGGLESNADGEWEPIDAESAVRILDTASGGHDWLLGAMQVGDLAEEDA